VPSFTTLTGGAPPLPTPDTALFLDLDGTLLELQDLPSAVRVEPSLRRLLATLEGTFGGALALVSGRAIADLDRLLAPLSLPSAGQHGLEWRGADGVLRRHPAPALPARVPQALAAFAAAHPGTVFEPKGASFALHFRGHPEAARAATALVTDLAAQAGSAWEVLHGKMLVELRPAGVHKGVAIRRLLEQPPFAGRQPVFLGDDWTDEDGFRAVNELGGTSVAVAVDRDSSARYRLGGVADVLAWLRRSVEVLPARGSA
jgi:trehalose 6-phosphate phosphatase